MHTSATWFGAAAARMACVVSRPSPAREGVRRVRRGGGVSRNSPALQSPRMVSRYSAILPKACFQPSFAPGSSAGKPACVSTILVRPPRSSNCTVTWVVAGFALPSK